MKFIKKYNDDIDFEDFDEEEVSDEEHEVNIPEDGETIVKINKSEWNDFVKFCNDYGFKWMSGTVVGIEDFDFYVKNNEEHYIEELDTDNIFITLFSDHTMGFGLSDFADPYDDYYYTLKKFLSKFGIVNEHVFYSKDDNPMGGGINYKELYKLEGNKILVYPIRIEEDMQKKLKIDCLYTSFSNGKLNMYFQIFENAKFESLRKVKKYFLDTIPHCTNVFFDGNGFTVQLTRVCGLDVLNVNEY